MAGCGWGSLSLGLQLPTSAPEASRRGRASLLRLGSQEAGPCLPLRLGTPGVGHGRGGSLTLPPAAEGPPLHRGAHVQAVLPLLPLLLLLAAFHPVDLHGLGGLGLPHISRAVGQSHGCENNNLPSQGCRVTPPGVGPASRGGLWVAGWGFSLQWADRGMEA